MHSGETAGRQRPVAVLILGMHRSGTSLTAGLMRHLGVFFGDDMMPANATNPKGFFEPNRVVALHDEIFDALERRWDDPRPMPEGWLESEAIAGQRRELAARVKSDYAGQRLWGVKDPRLSRLFPLWKPMLDNLGAEIRVLVVYRHPLEVAASLHDRDDMDYLQGIGLWTRYMLWADRATRGERRAFVDGNALVADWQGVITAAASELGLALALDDPRALEDASGFVSGELFHHVGPRLQVGDSREEELAEEMFTLLAETGIGGPESEQMEALEARLARGRHSTPAFVYLEAQVKELRAELRSEKTIVQSERAAAEQARAHGESALTAERRIMEEWRARADAAEEGLRAEQRQRLDLQHEIELVRSEQKYLEREREQNVQMLIALRDQLAQLHALLLRREQRVDKLVHLPHRIVRRSLRAALTPPRILARPLFRRLPLSAASKRRLKERAFTLFPSVFAGTDALRVWERRLPMPLYLRRRVSRIRSRRHFDPHFYRIANPDLSGLPDDELEKHYREHGAPEGRPGSAVQFFRAIGVSHRHVPRAFNYLDYFEYNEDLASMRAQGPIGALEHYLRHGRHEGRIYDSRQLFAERGRRITGDRRSQRRGVPSKTQARPQRLVVLAHVYYPELWQELRGYLENCQSLDFHLYVNLVDSTWTRDCLDAIRRDYPQAYVQISENRGRDIGGYLSLMRSIPIRDYDVALLLHTKKSPHVSAAYSARWKEALIAPLLGSPEQIERNLATFRADPDLGIIGSAACRLTDMGQNIEKFAWLAGRLGIEASERTLEYVSGTMKLVRTEILEALAKGIAPEDMINGDGLDLQAHLDGQLAHAAERIFCPLARSMGYKMLWQVAEQRASASPGVSA